jgi:hypothetical protein
VEYVLLIYDDEQQWASMPPEESGAVIREYGAYSNMLRERGAYLRGDALQPTATATTVQVREGETLTSDGPFAETKEQLGGLYVIQAKDLDEAIELAAKIPSARYGRIEVRPVMEMPAGSEG